MKSIPLESDDLPSIVLIVDSDERMLASYSAQFEEAGLWVATSSSPVEAIEAVRELRPNLVVTTTFDDIDFDLVSTLKSDARTTRLPVILLTEPADDARTEPADGAPSATRLADLCLRKPVATRQLLDSSQQLIARSHESVAPPEPVAQPAHQLVRKTDEAGKRNAQTKRSCPGC